MSEIQSRLTVVELIRETGQRTIAVCQCECGTIKHIAYLHVKSGAIKSCGCLKREMSRELGKANTRHGHSAPENRSHTYRSWESMKARCEKQNDPAFRHYGGRGITVCERWHSYLNFLEDMGERPRGSTLDRIDTNGNYEPQNCRWATAKTQQRNRRNNRIVEYRGESMTLVELSEITGVPYQRLHERIVRRGWSVEDAVSKPSRAFS